MENNYLDKRIREMMDNLDGDLQGGHWEQMEQLLNDPANADLSENELDHSLRNKLTDIEPAFSAVHWDLFEQQLDTDITSPEIDDVYLDGVTYELLNDLETPYDPNHWTIMQKRLEEEFSLRYKLVKYKVAEMALIALALFTVVSYLPMDKISAFHLPLVKTTTPVVEKTLNQTVTTIKPEESDTLDKTIHSTPSAKSKEESNTLASISSQSVNQASSKTLLEDSNISNPAIAQNKPRIVRNNQILDPIQGSDLTTAELTIVTSNNKVIPNTFNNLLTEEEKIQPLNIADLLKEHIRVIPQIKGLGISELDQKDNNGISDISTHNIWKSPSFLRIGMIGAGDLNYIMTPYNVEYDQAAINTFESGYGGGITLGYKFGRWEIESGAMYSNKYYSPDTINVTFTAGNIGYGYEGLGWKGTQLDVLRIPIRAKFGVFKRDKWHLYTQAGIAANLTLNRIHSKEIVILEPENSLRSPGEPTYLQITSDINDNVGLLAGGNFKDNHYLTAEIGFGLERFLSSRFSFFTQPTFLYQLGQSKIGLNKERINTLSLEAGIRVSLKRNK